MVQKDRPGLVLHDNTAQNFWLETKVMGMVFIFSRAQVLEDICLNVGSSSDWSISHADPINRLYSSIDAC